MISTDTVPLWLYWLAMGLEALFFFATYRHLDKQHNQTKADLEHSRARRYEAVSKLHQMLEWFERDDRFDVRALDDVLARLPRNPEPGHSYYTALQLHGPAAVAEMLCTDQTVPAEETVDFLTFDRVPFTVCGRRITAWKRGGWVLIPEEETRL